MPKSLFIDPAVVRAPGKLSFDDIPMNTYQKTVKDELGNFTRQQFLDIYRDMFLLRELETMINLIKTTGEYNGVAYNHPGPAHLSMGQEASAVGQAFNLDVDDFIFGSHRSHGEILAKGMSAIRKLDDDKLMAAMSEESGKAALGVVSGRGQSSVKELAEENKDMLAFVKESLGDKVKDVRLSGKLKSHAVCITTDGMISTEMEKVLNAMPAQEKIKAQRVLEINGEHPIFQRLQELYQSDKERLKLYAEILYDQALLLEGISLEDPSDFSQKLCQLL